MKILAINGSHRVGENTSKLLQMALFWDRLTTLAT